VDGRVISGTADQATGAKMIDPDPTLVLGIESYEGKQAVLTSWPVPVLPSQFLAGLQGYMAQAAHAEGVSPAELQRLSGDATSGYAIALTNEGKRQAQRRFGPQFQARDRSLLVKSAALWNRAHPDETQYPEGPYTVSYQAIPRSDIEERALREQLDWELTRGYLTPAEALARLRDISVSEAERIIVRVAASTPPAREPEPPETPEDSGEGARS
jgi:hypothetical protein